MSGYGAFAAYYDALTNNVEYKKRAEYFCTLLSARGVQGGTLVDLACGTGSLIVEFARRGFEVIGVDASAAMLCHAQQKGAQLDTPPLLLCQRMQDLDLYGTVDAVVCALDSINHLTDLTEVKTVFERVALFLNPGGVLVFDVNTIYKHAEILGNNAFAYDLEGLFCVWRNRYRKPGHVVDITLDFFAEDNGLWTRESEGFSERAYDLAELADLLTQCGFEPPAVYEELTLDAPTVNTQRAVFAARKAE